MPHMVMTIVPEAVDTSLVAKFKLVPGEEMDPERIIVEACEVEVRFSLMWRRGDGR